MLINNKVEQVLVILVQQMLKMTMLLMLILKKRTNLLKPRLCLGFK